MSRSALREFTRLDRTDQKRVRGALQKLALDVAGTGRVAGKGVKTIRGTDDAFHRLHVGDHRVMYDVIAADRVVLVLGIVGRSDLERWIRNR